MKKMLRGLFAVIGVAAIVFALTLVPSIVEHAHAVDVLRESKTWFIPAESELSVRETVRDMHEAHDAERVWTCSNANGVWVTVDQDRMQQLTPDHRIGVTIWS